MPSLNRRLQPAVWEDLFLAGRPVLPLDRAPFSEEAIHKVFLRVRLVVLRFSDKTSLDNLHRLHPRRQVEIYSLARSVHRSNNHSPLPSAEEEQVEGVPFLVQQLPLQQLLLRADQYLAVAIRLADLGPFRSHPQHPEDLEAYLVAAAR